MHMSDTIQRKQRGTAAAARRHMLYAAAVSYAFAAVTAAREPAGDYGRHAFGGRFGLVPSAALVERVQAERAGARS